MEEARKGKESNRRRFNDAQIQSLENMFESQARPELRVKQQLAKNLGLQPRQVAIWFQNKRARSKSKQMEHEYRVLKNSFDHLNSKFQTLKKEHESLLTQLQSLRKVSEENGDKESDEEEKQKSGAVESCSPEFVVPFCDGNSEQMEQPETETDVLNITDTGDASFSSIEERCGFQTNGFFDDSCCTSQWWDF